MDAEIKKFNRSFSSLNTAEVKQQLQFSKAILDTTDKQKKFKNITEDSFKVVEKFYSRGLLNEKKALEQVNKQIDVYANKHKTLQSRLESARVSGQTRRAENIESLMGRYESRTMGAMSKKKELEETINTLQQNPGLIEKIKSAVTGKNVIALGAVAAAVGADFEIFQNLKNLPSRAIAGTQAGTNQAARELAGGNLSSIFAMQNAGAQSAINKASGQGAPKGIEWAKIFGGGAFAAAGAAALVAGTGGLPLPLIGLAGGLGAGYSGIMNLKNNVPAKAEAQNINEAIQLQKQINAAPFLDIETADLNSKSRGRMELYRRLYTGEGGAENIFQAGKNLAFMGESESAQSALQLEQRIGGTRTKTFFPNMARIVGQGISTSGAAAITAGISQIGGQTGPGAVSKLIQDLIARGFEKTDDRVFVEKMGKFVSDNTIGVGGQLMSDKFGQAMMAALPKNPQEFQVNAAMQGVGLFGNIFGKQTGFQGAVGFETAKGMGFGGIQSQALTSAQIPELLSGSARLRALGISNKQARQFEQKRLMTTLQAEFPSGSEDFGLMADIQRHGSLQGALNAANKSGKINTYAALMQSRGTFGTNAKFEDVLQDLKLASIDVSKLGKPRRSRRGEVGITSTAAAALQSGAEKETYLRAQEQGGDRSRIEQALGNTTGMLAAQRSIADLGKEANETAMLMRKLNEALASGDFTKFYDVAETYKKLQDVNTAIEQNQNEQRMIHDDPRTRKHLAELEHARQSEIQQRTELMKQLGI
ncbi:MAG: hypothetical protein KGO96_07720 [Elusimicrobia bacterium]|nr:hypothetical protein [Elusimicrobiota bacterium]